MLSEKEQLLLSRLSVFAGGWTLEAAAAVCAGTNVEAFEVLDLLPQLVDKSLALMETHGARARYRLLETVRQYGRARLRETGEEANVLRRHGEFFLAFAEGAALHMNGPEFTVWLDALENEHDNLRAAFSSCLETGNLETAARLEVTLWESLVIRGYVKEGWEWLSALLARDGELPALLRERVRSSAVGLLFSTGEYRKAVALGQETLGPLRRLRDVREIARCTYNIGKSYTAMGEHERAAEHFDKSMRLYRDLGDDVLFAEALRNRGHVEARRGDYGRATAMLEDALARLRHGRYRRGTAYALTQLGLVKLYQKEFEGAESLLKEALAQFRDVGDKEGLTFALSAMGGVRRCAEDLERAATCYRESLTRSREIGMNWTIARCLCGLAAIAAARKRSEESARLFGAAVKLCETTTYALSHAEQLECDGVLASLRRALGEKAYARAVGNGTAMTLEQAIEAALAPAQDVKVGSPGNAGEKPRILLTLREQEVAALVAQGLTNRRIASRLVITEKTVDTHVQNILNKLGAHTRTQIALWSAEHRMEKAATD
jgi:non-specific serine/threonine protein kinase